MTQLSITPEQQLELDFLKLKILQIDDINLLRAEYIHLAKTNMEMRNTCIHLIGKHWGISMITETKVAIDWKLASDILDRLGYSLRDLSIEYGDVVIPSGDISHELYYPSSYNNHNLLGFVWIENGIYYAKHEHNHKTAEMAALDLLDEGLVQATAAKILLDRQLVPDYF